MPWGPLRAIEALQIEHEGQPMIMLRDPEGLLPDPILMPLPMFMLATLFDGQRDTREVQQMLARASGGKIVPTEQLDKIAEQLDQLHLFENDRTRKRRTELEEEFEALPLRPAVHAGLSYPAEPGELLDLFNEFFAGLAAVANGNRPRGIITPHIDMRLGGRLLAEGVARVKAEAPPQLYIIFGVAHQPSRNLFTLTDKDFETPLGTVETDKSAATRLRDLYGADRLSGAFAHAREHSIEFPVIALKYWHSPSERPFKILPILCGMLPEERGKDEPQSEVLSKLILPDSAKTHIRKTPIERPAVGEFITALKQLIAEYDGEVIVLVSVDLAHVGLKFGEQRGIDDERATQVEAADQAMLGVLTEGDPEAWFDYFRADQNARNVDGVTAIYLLLHLLDVPRVEQISYRQWKEEPTDSMVTFASAAVY